MHGRRKILFHFALWEARHKWVTLAAALGLSIILGYFSYLLKLNLGFLNLLDRDDPEVIKVDYVNENFGGMDYTFVTFESDNPQRTKECADVFAENIRGDEMVSRVIHRIEADELLEHAFLFITPDEIVDFENFVRENQKDMIEVFRDAHVAPFLARFNDMLERQIIEEDEISDSDDAMARLQSFDDFFATMGDYFQRGEQLGSGPLKKSLRNLFVGQSDQSDFKSLDEEYFMSLDGRAALVMTMSSEPGDDLQYTKRYVTFLESAINKLLADFPGVTATISGNTAIMRDEYDALKSDMRISTAVTFILVLLIFLIFFRKFSDLIVIFVSLTVGLIWTYGLTQIFIGHLSVTTAFNAAILIGLGIDFAIHVIARYNEELAGAGDVNEAIARSMAGAGLGIITGAVTTSVAFLALLTCDFKGIFELGFVSGVGVLMMLSAVFILLPPLLSIRDGRRDVRRFKKPARELIDLSRLSDVVVNHRAVVLIATLIGTAIMFHLALGTEFNYDFRSLEPRGSPSVAASHKFEKDFGKSLDYSVLWANDVAESRRLAARIEKDEGISEVKDISEFLPEDQAEKAPLIRKIEPLLTPIHVENRVDPKGRLGAEQMTEVTQSLAGSKKVLKAVLQLAVLGGQFDVEDKAKSVIQRVDTLIAKIDSAGSQYYPGAGFFERTFGHEIEKLLGQLKLSAKAEPLGIEGLPQSIRDNFIGKDGRFLVYAYPSGYIWKKEILKSHMIALREVSENSTSVGSIFVHLVDIIIVESRQAVAWSLLGVFLLVLLDFRRPLTALISLIPLILAAIWMVGTMKLLDIKFNLINVAMIPLIIGIGIDDGVHIIHRYRGEVKNRIHRAVQLTGRAVVLTSITTMSGFGSLGFASYILVASLGWVLVIGVFYCMLASVVVLPALMSLLEKRINI